VGPVLRHLAVLLCALVALERPADGQESATPADQSASPAPAASPHEGDFWTRDALTGNWGGLRSKLEDKGIDIDADTIDEVLGNPSGGTRQGAIYEGRLELIATVDLAKTLGWTGATAHANAYQIRGRGLSANNLGNNLATVSDIEAARSFRLFDLWIEQSLFNTTLTIRAGQIAADDEFFISPTAATFINSTFGWPAIMGADLPSGGPAYPLATPGLRVKYAATQTISALAGLFNGDPAGSGTGNPQLRDASGTAFRIGGSALAILEGGYAVNQDPAATGLPASYKLGLWFHSGQFADQKFDTTGLSLASPASSGIPAMHQHDGGGYLVLDQALFNETKPESRNISVFLRVSGAPSDRNPVDLYADAGITLTGFVAGRANDTLGFAVAVARIGANARSLDEDVRSFTGLDTPVRDEETAFELTYRAQVTPWWSLQPDLQFIRHPRGGVAPQGSPPGTQAIPDAVVLGLRSAIVF
jgi:porin